MVTVRESLEVAFKHQQMGHLQQAEQIYHQILKVDPRNADALHLLGLLARRIGKNDIAIDYIKRSLRVYPSSFAAHNNLGNALRDLGRNAEALTSLREAVRIKPDFGEGHNNLGLTLANLGRHEEALASYREALRFKPDYAEAHNNAGNALTLLGRRPEAEVCYREAMRLKPDYVMPYNNLGVLLVDLGRVEEALGHYQEAIRLQPDFAQVYNNRGVAQTALGRVEEALASYREAIRLKAGWAEPHANLGATLTGAGRSEEALTWLHEALRLDPHCAETHSNMGRALALLGRDAEALASYAQSLRLKPDYPKAHNNLALSLLLAGDYERGWQEYEWRLRCYADSIPQLPGPRWDGSPLQGRTIVLRAEQGLGDTLQFVRYAPLVQQRGGKVVLACQKPLLRLLANVRGVDQLVAQDDPLPPFDVNAPLLSLPALLGTTLDTIPAEVPYLRAEPELVERWHRQLSQFPGLKVGIAWQGNSKYSRDYDRSIPLRLFEPLAQVEGVTLISLQKGPGSEQLTQLGGRFAVHDLGEELDAAGAFVDTAAVMMNLDLVVTSDTAVPHLAGALGVPVWVALSKVPDWRFLLDRQDSPWYPSMRLFRQTERGQWPPVFERLAAQLRQRASINRRRGGIKVETAPGELIDKITILEIKNERIRDPAKLRNVRRELSALCAARQEAVPDSAPLRELTAELKTVNEALWDIEDEIRRCEAQGNFGARFVELARAVYHQNDRRAALKRRLNDLLGSDIVEEKDYIRY